MENTAVLKLRDFFKNRDYGDVLMVGGGISGIQAALNLANSGFKVYLLDKAPTIGGHMAMLDKTFPTNDCSMCIESPKFVECYRHPNIELLTSSEVEKVTGSAGNFTVTIVKKPRYVIESKCTDCTSCVEHCPVKYPDQFNQNISKNKAIHIYFAQAVPLVTYIDQSCLYLQEKKCGICESVCKTSAIDFTQKPEYRTLKVGVIIISPGFSAFDAAIIEFGYGRYKDIVTGPDYERLLCATGPFEGEVLRISDHKYPEKIAWIHCVGSKSVVKNSNTYCSSVCCTYTQKQIILTKGHDEDAECVAFHNDIRSYGKDFERFFKRVAILPGVRFIRNYVSVVGENQENKNVILRYSTFDKGVVQEEFDMVVLSVGLNPPADNEKIRDIFGIKLNNKGFSSSNYFDPVETNVKGIFVSVAFLGPMDIPEAVFTASSAVSKCGEILKNERWKLSKEREYPFTLENLDIKTFLDNLIKMVFKHPLTHVYMGGKVVESTGYVGNFLTKIETSNNKTFEIKHGATVIAVGAKEYKPEEYLYGKSNLVKTNLELENMIGRREKSLLEAESVGFIQCVGCRNEERSYCSKICYTNSIKLAIKLKEIDQRKDIYVFFRDMRTYGFREDYFSKASELGVKFIRYDADNPPIVEDTGDDKTLNIRAFDHVLNKMLEVSVNYLFLASAVIPNEDAATVAKYFKVNLGTDGFFQEAHVKLRPVDFGAEGVYLCGTAHYPKFINETISQAYAAAGRVVTLLSHDTIVASGSVCVVNEKSCIGCGACVDACTYGAIELKKTNFGHKATVNPILFKGDGLCNSKCLTYAISLKHFTEDQLIKQILATKEKEADEKLMLNGVA